MKSIRGRLILFLVCGVLLLELATGAGLFDYVQDSLENSLDAALLAKGTAIASAVHIEDGKPQLETPAAELSEPAHNDGPFYFQIWQQNGASLARVGPQGNSEPLPRLANEHKQFGDIVLPGGTSARAMELTFTRKPDEDEGDRRSSAHTSPGETLTLIVAHDRRSIDQPLAVLLSGLLITALIITVGIIGIVTWAVRRGLRPLVNLAAHVEKIGPETLNVRCPVTALPHEIQPITEKVNDLLDRLEQAFTRERRFSADVAHELRTPLAELRSLCEVSLRWPDNNTTETVHEALAIAKQMEETVNSLLSLVRIQAGVETPKFEEIDLIETIQNAWKPLEHATESKHLTVQHLLGTPIVLRTDRALFAQAIRNLLANAIQHSPEAGYITIEITHAEKSATIRIRNTNVSLTATDLPHLCEPFWRKDSARTDHFSAGLGLTIVDEYCRAIGTRLQLKLPDPLWFEASITVDGAASHSNSAVTSREDNRTLPIDYQ